MKNLCFILGDQLSMSLSSLKACDKAKDVILMCEVQEEATYVRHHKKKIAFVFSAMRHFAEELKEAGYRVDYVRLDDPQNTGSFTRELQRAVKRHSPAHLHVTQPGEYRVLESMKAWEKTCEVPVTIHADDRFLCGIEEFQDWTKGRKSLRMEFFYREMRRKYNILMNGDKPEGGGWNYDSENRKSFDGGFFIPKPYQAQHDAITRDVLQLVERRFAEHFGDLEPFYFAVTRGQALEALKRFIADRLPLFGDYQDAMLQGEPWLYHSHLSFYLNCGLLLPLECAQAAESAYRSGHAPLNAAEGFIRQIIGWREYVRGIYWKEMPAYTDQNYLEAKRDLPWFYWSGETKMNCLRQCVDETKRHAYAHHIQRLMVLGNFALLAGVDPRQVNEWFLIVYADAYEWVEMPNVSGMILYADGGLLASKPYAAGGAYINKMSDYCGSCAYKVSEKNGPKACPFNYLYWDFLLRNRENLKNNPRLGMSYRTLERMSEEKIRSIKSDSESFLAEITGEAQV